MNILILINGWTTKISGGDYHILKVSEFWGFENKIDYILPKLGYENAKEFLNGRAFVYNTFYEKEVNSTLQVLILYFIRLMKLFFHPITREYSYIIASSHFLIDIIPAYYFYTFNPQSKLIAYYHGLQVRDSQNISFRRVNDLISIILLKKFNLIFVVNKETKNYLIKKGIKKSNIQITSNGIILNNYPKQSKTKLYDACFLGRLDKIKGIYDLVDIWYQLNKKLNAKLIIIGDGPHKKALINKINRKKLDKNILILGHLNDSKKFDYLMKSKLFLFPSYYESWGTVIAEAFACSLPVIAYDLKIYDEIFPGLIITVKKGDIKNMVKKTYSILNNKNLIYERGQLGKNFVKKFDFNQIAQKELLMINELIK